MKRAMFLLLPVGLALFQAGCGNERALEGSSSETENVLSARIYRVDSLLSDWNHPVVVPTVATLRLDSSNFPFHEASRTGSEITVERIDSTPIPFRIVYWDKLAARGRIEVRLDPSSQTPGFRFRLRWNAKDSARSDSAKVWRSLPDSQRFALTSLLVDDFEHASTYSLLPDSAQWFTRFGDSGTATVPDIVAADRGRTGNALHFSYMGEKGWVYGGVSLAKGKPRSLRSLDSLVFWVRGPVKLAVGFDHRDVGKAWVINVMDSNWTRRSVRPQDLDPPGAGGNIGWSGVRDSVTDIVFFVSQGSDIWLDDIRLHGLSRDDLK